MVKKDLHTAREQCERLTAEAANTAQEVQLAKEESLRIGHEMVALRAQEAEKRTHEKVTLQQAEKALEAEKAAREAAESELQATRTLLRELQSREALSSSTVPRIAETLRASKISDAIAARNAEEELQSEMDAVEDTALN